MSDSEYGPDEFSEDAIHAFLDAMKAYADALKHDAKYRNSLTISDRNKLREAINSAQTGAIMLRQAMTAVHMVRMNSLDRAEYDEYVRFCKEDGKTPDGPQVWYDRLWEERRLSQEQERRAETAMSAWHGGMRQGEW